MFFYVVGGWQFGRNEASDKLTGLDQVTRFECRKSCLS